MEETVNNTTVKYSKKKTIKEMFRYFIYKFKSRKNNNYITHFNSELEILKKQYGDDLVIKDFIPAIKMICKAFAKQGNSGCSASISNNIISNTVRNVLSFKPLSLITGEDWEWNEVTDSCYQNKRLSSLFKEEIDSRPYYLDAIVWRGQYNGDEGTDKWSDTFTGTVDGIKSRQYVKLPFTPKTFYVDVIREQLPPEWTEEPYIEGSETYDNAEYEKTGVKNWKKNNYRYHIKDQKQLEEVFKYYEK